MAKCRHPPLSVFAQSDNAHSRPNRSNQQSGQYVTEVVNAKVQATKADCKNKQGRANGRCIAPAPGARMQHVERVSNCAERNQRTKGMSTGKTERQAMQEFCGACGALTEINVLYTNSENAAAAKCFNPHCQQHPHALSP